MKTEKAIEHKFDYPLEDYIHNLLDLFLAQNGLEFQIVRLGDGYYIAVVDNQREKGNELVYMSVIKAQTNYIMLDVYNICGFGNITAS